MPASEREDEECSSHHALKREREKEGKKAREEVKRALSLSASLSSSLPLLPSVGTQRRRKEGRGGEERKGMELPCVTLLRKYQLIGGTSWLR